MSAGQSADRLSRYLVKSIHHSNRSVLPNCRGLMSRACSRAKFLTGFSFCAIFASYFDRITVILDDLILGQARFLL